MTAAAIAHPELLQSPRLAWRRIFHFHLVAAPLAANLEDRVSHAADCSSTRSRALTASGPARMAA
jgi:hypothetical protein